MKNEPPPSRPRLSEVDAAELELCSQLCVKSLEDDERRGVKRLSGGTPKASQFPGLTEQQRAIVNLAKAPDDIPFPRRPSYLNGEIIRVTAAAGTGKTKTLEAVAVRLLELGHEKVTYLTFNREQKVDAEERFRKALEERGIEPGKVQVRTLHGLAGELLGVQHVTRDRMNEGKLNLLTLQLFGDKIDEFLRTGGVDNAGYKVRRQRAFWIAKTMVTFLQTRQYENDEKAFDMYYPAKLYYEDKGQDKGQKRLEDKTLEQAASFYHDCAKRLWDELRVDPQTRKSRSGEYMHDVIQKQAQLDSCAVHDCRAILVDESQDLTECQIAWITSQRGSKKDDTRRQVFIVGDMAQTIYSFRGAKSKNLLNNKPDIDRDLTQSFRFDYPIARVANTILYGKMNSPQAKDFRPYTVQVAAHEKKSSEVFHYGKQVGPADAVLKLRERCAKREEEKRDRMVTVIAFKNGTLIKTALNLLHKCPKLQIAVCGDEEKETSGRGKYISVCNHIQAFYDLFKGVTNSLPRGEYFKAFCDPEGDPLAFAADSTQAWNVFCKEVEERELTEFSMYVDIIETFQGDTMDKVKELKENVLNRDPKDCDVLLTTIHSAKGLEWTNVVVLDDLTQLAAFSIKGSTRAQFAWKGWGDDMNLWYVAVTRAKRRLVVPRAFVDVYDAFNEAKRIAEDDDPRSNANADHILPPYDNVANAKTYKPDQYNKSYTVPQVFRLNEVKLIHELGKDLWKHCGVLQPPNVIEIGIDDDDDDDDIFEATDVSPEEAERRKLEEAKEKGFFVELEG